MLSEIGSDFWSVNLSSVNQFSIGSSQVCLLSGRTALDYIIREIQTERPFVSVYMPSYCCHTMIEPFVRNGIRVFFYDLDVAETGMVGFHPDIDCSFSCDAILLMQYFGYENRNIDGIAQKFRERGITVIEDITHSMFCEKPCTEHADYLYGSLRKWAAFYSGAIAVKRNGQFTIRASCQTNEWFCRYRMKAVELKEEYMREGGNTKEQYLSLFHQSEICLEKDYRGYLMDNDSQTKLKYLDVAHMKQCRRRNAAILISAISGNPHIRPVVHELSDGDTPLFVPVIMSHKRRDAFRDYLTENKIYCPVHWERSVYHNISVKAQLPYQNLLSLVCDQRYEEDSMQVFADKIAQFKG